jgi:hypothetical protein
LLKIRVCFRFIFRERSFSEDEAEADAYFKQYVTSTFHPDDKTADNKIRVIYPLVNKTTGVNHNTNGAEFVGTGAAIRHEGARPPAEPL